MDRQALKAAMQDNWQRSVAPELTTRLEGLRSHLYKAPIGRSAECPRPPVWLVEPGLLAVPESGKRLEKRCRSLLCLVMTSFLMMKEPGAVCSLASRVSFTLRLYHGAKESLTSRSQTFQRFLLDTTDLLPKTVETVTEAKGPALATGLKPRCD